MCISSGVYRVSTTIVDTNITPIPAGLYFFDPPNIGLLLGRGGGGGVVLEYAKQKSKPFIIHFNNVSEIEMA